MADEGIVTYLVKVEGKQIPDEYEISSLEINQQVNSISSAVITLKEEYSVNKKYPASASDLFIPGKKLSIEAGYSNQTESIFSGIVVSQSISLDSEEGTMLTVQCKDPAVLMAAARKNGTFQKIKDSAAISKIIGNYSGLTASVSETSVEVPLLQQYYCSDWDFIVTRAEANGLIVVNENGKVSAIKPDADTTSVATVDAEGDLLELSADLNSIGQVASMKASAWDPESQKVIESESEPAGTGPGNLSSKDIADAVGSKDPGLLTMSQVSSDDLKSWSAARMVKCTYSKVNATAVTHGNPKLKVGCYLTLGGTGARFDGDHLISAVTHSIEDGTWTSKVELGLSAEWFTETRRDISAPAASGLLPGIGGLCSAVVKQIHDDPDNGFRIMINLPMFNTDDDGIWARLIQDYASDGAGFFFYPEVGDEVVVGFLNNDPCFPVVLGGVYSGKHKPQSDLTPDEKNSKKAVVTKAGLTLLFNDEDKVVTVKTPGNNSVVLDDKNKKVAIEDQNGNSLVMGDSGITIKSSKNITLQAEQKVSLKGDQGVSQEASGGDVAIKGMNVKQSADAELSLEGSATAKIQGGTELSLKGAMVMIN
ncbi:phage baseplate assembly protein V [Bacterioplanoides sp.]|uniref:phage baseplate assembly protein V n=1 Tax=Bacterioplanoides sp. TaxID=2066072 RepID=UPI003B5C39A4